MSCIERPEVQVEVEMRLFTEREWLFTERTARLQTQKACAADRNHTDETETETEGGECLFIERHRRGHLRLCA